MNVALGSAVCEVFNFSVIALTHTFSFVFFAFACKSRNRLVVGVPGVEVGLSNFLIQICLYYYLQSIVSLKFTLLHGILQIRVPIMVSNLLTS